MPEISQMPSWHDKVQLIRVGGVGGGGGGRDSTEIDIHRPWEVADRHI